MKDGEVCFAVEGTESVKPFVLSRSDQGGKFSVIEGLKAVLKPAQIDYNLTDKWEERERARPVEV